MGSDTPEERSSGGDGTLHFRKMAQRMVDDYERKYAGWKQLPEPSEATCLAYEYLKLSASSEKSAPIEKCPDGQKCHSTTTGYCWGRCMRTAALSAIEPPEWTVRFSENGEEYYGYLTVRAHSLERTDTGNGFIADGVRVEIDEHITEVEGPK